MKPIRVMKCVMALIAIGVVQPLSSIHAETTTHSPDTVISADERAAIMDLFARYALYVDAREAEAYASVFLPDGALIFPSDKGGERIEIRGRAALAATVREWAKAGKTRFHSPLLSTMIKIGPGHVKAISQVMVGHLDPSTANAAKLEGLGVYYDDIILTPSGWKFQQRDAYIYNGRELPKEFLPQPDRVESN